MRVIPGEEEDMDTIYITGHRNPDTDSVISAMAYAALKNALGDRRYKAARLGQISDETQIVLDRFGFQPPRLLTDVRTQVRDLDYDTPPTLSPAATISRGWQTMQKERISALPVTNEDGTLYGMLSAGDVANYDMSSVRNPQVGEVPVYNLLSVLEGKILNEDGQIRDILSGEVIIALPASRENLVSFDENSIVICGDQPDMIRRALEKKVSCVIVCQAEVSPELVATDGETCIISTPFDAYRAVRLICHALPISSICKSKDLVCFHLDDYIDDVKDAVLESRFRAYPILDEEERVVGTLSRFHLLRPRRKRVVLMDHNERAQSVHGLEQAEILEIVDHHRLADIETSNPIYVRNEPVGSTTTIVAGMYQEKGLMPTAKMAGLMAAAIVSDTVMFKSPTCTRRDIDVATRMAKIANVSLEDLGKAIFSATSGDDKSVEAMLGTDYKEFHIAGHTLAVSQITCMDSDRLLKRKEEFLAAMEKNRKARGLEMVVLMITDVLLEGTQLIFTGNEEPIRQAFNLKNAENSAFLPKVMSRKKQVIPTLSAMWG
jgi:manganese-dependent inorganic pyrophosphatase|nr:putative manganese-dependent inorganic diphosphatase [uncultured Oscillibacter sp.]